MNTRIFSTTAFLICVTVVGVLPAVAANPTVTPNSSASANSTAIDSAAASVATSDSLLGPTPSSSLKHENWEHLYPYVPEVNEYQFEVGGLHEDAGLYWLGGTYGRLLGRCLGFANEVCHQYFDINLGYANNYQASDTFLLGGFRWQFARERQVFSPFFRFFAGGADEHDSVRGGTVGTYGAGVGLTATVHPRFDITAELRAGEADRFWSVALFSFSVRLDKAIGKTVDATGSILKSTISAPKTFIDWFNKKDSESK